MFNPLKIKKFGAKKVLKILFVAAEAMPFAKAGGLGDVMFSLPLALRKQGQDARIFIPRYATIDTNKYRLDMKIEGLKIPTDQPGPDPYLTCNVKVYLGGETAPAYFLENMEYYEQRANVYGYSDDHIRWALLCRGVLEFVKQSSWVPDIIVASDWQVGLIANYLKTSYKKDPVLSKISTVFSIHNLSYQGMCDFRYMNGEEKDDGKEGVPDFFNPKLAKLNWMLRGIINSDLITTVSPNYAKEILTQEYGEGLEKNLNEKANKIYGILNGISYDIYNPQTNPNIPFPFSSRAIKGRIYNKLKLQEKFDLQKDKNVFLIGMVSRLAEQKGFDLIEKIIETLFKHLPVQLICLGDGESRYKEIFKKAAEMFPKRVACSYEFDHDLPHLVFSGSDAILIPSKYEPCGIVQMQAMRYGAIPIARKTGGLADTIKDFRPEEEVGEGFLFKDYDPMALLNAICRAHTSFFFKNDWDKLVKRAMAKDFSWERSAKEYIKAFQAVLA